MAGRQSSLHDGFSAEQSMLEKQVTLQMSPASQASTAPDCVDDLIGDLRFVRLESCAESDEDSLVEGRADSSTAAEDEVDDEPRMCTGMPPLQSELAKWAQWAIAHEEFQAATLGKLAKHMCSTDDDDDSCSESDSSSAATDLLEFHVGVEEYHSSQHEVRLLESNPRPADRPRLCTGLAPLRSDLAKLARWEVSHEEFQAASLEKSEESNSSASDCEADGVGIFEDLEEADLAKFARWAVAHDEKLEECNIACDGKADGVGTPSYCNIAKCAGSRGDALQSDLAKWAQAAVDSEEQQIGRDDVAACEVAHDAVVRCDSACDQSASPSPSPRNIYQEYDTKDLAGNLSETSSARTTEGSYLSAGIKLAQWLFEPLALDEFHLQCLRFH